MKILVLNSGSSSIKYKLFSKDLLEELYCGIKEEVVCHTEALDKILNQLIQDKIIKDFSDICVVGHRVVHGGVFFDKPIIIDDNICKKIDELSILAPLHNPSNLAGIEAIKKLSTTTKQVAVFDTAFHQTIPNFASIYPLPYEYYEKYNIKKYGFHGTSHQYVAKKASEILDKKLENTNLITLHLGNGASICAIKDGISIDTSMGFTPLEGLMMGTRCGDIDSSLVVYLQDKLKLSTNEINKILNKQSGFKGICGNSDLREVIKLSQDGDKKATLAIEMFVYRIKKYIGSYLMILEDVDAIIFTGGIGENSKLIRDMIISSTDKFNIKSLVIPTNEELAIAQFSKELL
ncbi:MAG: acetate kinase [Epsilonproteobacteria bacterium]|nr:MAG: acetate kinase [Campylobacterota bacterium]